MVSRKRKSAGDPIRVEPWHDIAPIMENLTVKDVFELLGINTKNDKINGALHEPVKEIKFRCMRKSIMIPSYIPGEALIIETKNGVKMKCIKWREGNYTYDTEILNL